VVREIPLTQGKAALVDDEDYDRVAALNWCATKYDGDLFYARCTSLDVDLHRFILDAPRGLRVDHKNGDGLDCQRSNLRYATVSQNAQNKRRSRLSRWPYKGITHMGPRFKSKPFRAVIKLDGVHRHIGTYATAEEAARAYDQKARELFGEFARLNFPEDGHAVSVH
jgi:hypothetical protein